MQLTKYSDAQYNMNPNGEPASTCILFEFLGGNSLYWSNNDKNTYYKGKLDMEVIMEHIIYMCSKMFQLPQIKFLCTSSQCGHLTYRNGEISPKNSNTKWSRRFYGIE